MSRRLALAAFCAAALLPLVLGTGGAFMEHVVLAAAYVVMALGLNVVVGFAGLLDLGYVAFFAIGAHVAAYLGSAFWGLHFDFLVILAFAILAAAAAGVTIVRTKLTAYAVGGAMGGVSGAFLASFLGTVNPTQFTYSFSIFILAMVVLGGLGSVWGVVLGAVALSAINSSLLPDVLYDVPARIGLDFDLSQISAGIYGVLIVVIMLLRPQGLLAEWRPQRMEKGLTAPRPRRTPGAAGRATVG